MGQAEPMRRLQDHFGLTFTWDELRTGVRRELDAIPESEKPPRVLRAATSQVTDRAPSSIRELAGAVGVVMAEFPDWIEPMAATLTQERFTGPEWIFERKLDGIRLLAFKQRRRRPTVLAQPAAAELVISRGRGGDRGASAARADPRRRSYRRMGADGQRRLSRLRHPLARRTRRDDRCRSTSGARCLPRLPLRAPLARVPDDRRRRTRGSARSRRAGRA